MAIVGEDRDLLLICMLNDHCVSQLLPTGNLEPVSATWYGTPWTVLEGVSVGHIKWQMSTCRVLTTNILGFNNHKDIPFILWQILEYLVTVFVYVCVYVCSCVCTVVCLHECAHVFGGQRSSSVFISQLLSTLVFEPASLTEPDAHPFS